MPEDKYVTRDRLVTRAKRLVEMLDPDKEEIANIIIAGEILLIMSAFDEYAPQTLTKALDRNPKAQTLINSMVR